MFNTADAPRPLTTNERQARRRAKDPDSVRRNFRAFHDKHPNYDDAAYLARPFIVWDGEGVTTDDGVHRYVMLAGKSLTDGVYQAAPLGLPTVVVFEMILKFAEANPGAIHVIYGGSYDFNMILRDLDRANLDAVYRRKFHCWNGYRIGWRSGKSFYVARVDSDGKTIGKGVTVYDVVSFFQCAFVKACDEYLGDDFTDRDLIVSNKALRSSFTLDDVPTVRRYNDAELDNLLKLVMELRRRLNNANLRPSRWDGPGAVAAALLRREKIKDAMSVCPPDVASAARYAYAGGRFELIRFGHVPDAPAYEYDINSAYPAGLRTVPNLQAGRWEHTDGDAGHQNFALYHVHSIAYRADIPAPLFRRTETGTVSYPLRVTGWYWTPEIDALREYAARGLGEFTVIETWTFVEDEGTPRPFEFIEPLYRKRQALKRGKDGAHVAYKLALNSMYGKLCQQVGAELTPDGWKIPPFHQLEWAGYTTSYCRANVLRAAMTNPSAVIAFETDAVFTSEPFDVVMGEDLGEFEAIEFTSLTYCQSGMYFATTKDGETVNKTRGVDRGTIVLDDVLVNLRQPKIIDRKCSATLTRFVGAGVALSQGMHKWRTWEVMNKMMSLEPTGKRIHIECDACHDGDGVAFGAWHETLCPMMTDEHSAEFPILWINPDPKMIELDELRREDVWYD